MPPGSTTCKVEPGLDNFYFYFGRHQKVLNQPLKAAPNGYHHLAYGCSAGHADTFVLPGPARCRGYI